MTAGVEYAKILLITRREDYLQTFQLKEVEEHGKTCKNTYRNRDRTMSISLLTIAILAILAKWVFSDILLEKRKKKHFLHTVFLTMIIAGAELGCALTDNTVPENRQLSIFFNILGFSLTPFVFLVEADMVKAKKRFLFYLPPVMNMVLTIASAYHGWIFFVEADCSYHRGRFFYLYLIAFLYSVLLALGKKLLAARNYPVYFQKRIIESGFLLVAGIMIQVIFPRYHTTWITAAFYLVLCYALSCEMSSLMDGLTGLLNRTAFNKGIERLKLSSKQATVLFMIDVNDFKVINDAKGHAYGDYYLKEIGEILGVVFSFNARIYRFGGDEFSVILSTKPSDEMEYTAKLVSLIKSRQKEDPDFPGVAVGYAHFETGKDARETMELADYNMYQDKRAKVSRG